MSNAKDKLLALSCITITSSFGFITNGLSLYITITNSHFQNAYGILCSAILLCNMQTLSIILIWGAAVLLTDSQETLLSKASSLNLIPGCLANVSFYGSILLNFLITLNRYCALAHPLTYYRYWSRKKARQAAIIAYSFGFLPCLPSIFERCTLVFNTEMDFRWSYSDTLCGNINGIFDMSFASSLHITATCINFITLLKIKNHCKLEKTNKVAAHSVNRKREMFFFKQSCISSFMLVTFGIAFTFGPYFLTNKWALFAATTISWQMAHALDGFILLIFIWHYRNNLRTNAVTSIRRQGWENDIGTN